METPSRYFGRISEPVDMTIYSTWQVKNRKQQSAETLQKNGRYLWSISGEVLFCYMYHTAGRNSPVGCRTGRSGMGSTDTTDQLWLRGQGVYQVPAGPWSAAAQADHVRSHWVWCNIGCVRGRNRTVCQGIRRIKAGRCSQKSCEGSGQTISNILLREENLLFA